MAHSLCWSTDLADYDFRTLSPNDFEILIRDLLEAEYGWRLEAFGRGRDGGIDLRASTTEGNVVVQCKHYLGSSFSDLRSSARLEALKMDKEKPDRYLFVTSQNLNRTNKDTLAGDQGHDPRNRGGFVKSSICSSRRTIPASRC
ncbi:restriction endonuclease [Streptomyces europaeiscabiei]|nr:restriction endonuclease [Streptomyces europaeiscabiei]MDX3654740.1 restriction endonuclease [Streptomyces europaeiscabiei]